MTITVNYVAKWQLKDKPHYKWTAFRKLINCKTNREIKKTVKSGIAGYWIGNDFVKLSELKSRIELIPKDVMPSIIPANCLLSMLYIELNKKD